MVGQQVQKCKRAWLIYRRCTTNSLFALISGKILPTFFMQLLVNPYTSVPVQNGCKRNLLLWKSHPPGAKDSKHVTEARHLEHKKSVPELVCALKQCSKTRDLAAGKALHLEAVEASSHTNKYVAAALITMYRKCRSMPLAHEVFDGMMHRDIVVWNSLILGYVQNGESLVAMDLFTRMDCEPDSLTYVAALKACGSLARQEGSDKQFCLEMVITIHKEVKERGHDSNAVVACTLVDMYGKCRSMTLAREVFDRMARKDVVTWNCLILAYVDNGEEAVAMDLFASMDCEPDQVTYVAALKACAGMACLEKGMDIHMQIKDRGFDTELVVATTMLEMYSKCGSMTRAREVFDKMTVKDVVTWNRLITGYVANGESSVVADLFTRIDCQPDSVTYIAALKACSDVAACGESDKQSYLQKGITIHREVKERGFDSGIAVANTLIDMYCKFGELLTARDIFNQMVHRNAVTWNCLIQGYVENSESSIAMDLFTSMDCDPTPVTYIAALKACGSLAAVRDGQYIHATLCKLGLEQNEMVANPLLDFYGKCGCMGTAEELFNGMHSPDIVSWNALIAGYTSLGDSFKIFSLAREIHETGLQMNSITFTCILTSCSHAGLVDECKTYFHSMLKYGVSPSMEHYNCMVDTLGRNNKLEEALSVINGMPFQANVVMWKTLLAACRKWKNVEMGKIAFDKLVVRNTQDSAPYVVMTDIYRSEKNAYINVHAKNILMNMLRRSNI